MQDEQIKIMIQRAIEYDHCYYNVVVGVGLSEAVEVGGFGFCVCS